MICNLPYLYKSAISSDVLSTEAKQESLLYLKKDINFSYIRIVWDGKKMIIIW